MSVRLSFNVRPTIVYCPSVMVYHSSASIVHPSIVYRPSDYRLLSIRLSSIVRPTIVYYPPIIVLSFVRLHRSSVYRLLPVRLSFIVVRHWSTFRPSIVFSPVVTRQYSTYGVVHKMSWIGIAIDKILICHAIFNIQVQVVRKIR